MRTYIEFEDLAPNALIVAMEMDKNCRSVSLSIIRKYGEAVVDVLSENGQNVILCLTKDDTNGFVRNNVDYFSFGYEKGEECIELNSDKTLQDLRQKFRTRLTIEIAKAMYSDKALAVIRLQS